MQRGASVDGMGPARCYRGSQATVGIIRSGLSKGAFCLALVVACGSPVWGASVDAAAFQGAWAQGDACKETFAAGKKGMVFKDPTDVFAQGFIISGKRLRTPGAVCRIRSVSSAGERVKLSLSCTTAVDTAPVKTEMSLGQDGVLTRFSDGEDMTGRQYRRCGP